MYHREPYSLAYMPTATRYYYASTRGEADGSSFETSYRDVHAIVTHR